MKNIKNIIFSFLLLIILTFTNCITEETSQLIDASISAGTLLTKYYDKLIKYTIETWEMESFISSVREVDFPIELQMEYEETITHLKKRKSLIQTYNKIFPLLEDFLKNKSSDDFKNTLTELSNNINDLPPLKNNDVILPSDVFGNLASDVIEIYKFFEIRYISKTLVKTLEKIKELYEKERELYSSIIEERNNKSLTIINYMIDNEMLIPWPLIESAPATVGLELAVARKPAKDDVTKKALKKVLEVKYFRMKYLIQSAENELSFLLLELISQYKDFITGKKIVLNNIFYIANRVGEYYQDIDEYYKKITDKETDQQNHDIIYHGNTDSKIFHQPSCQYYYSKNSTDIFYSRDEAINKGYNPCNSCNP